MVDELKKYYDFMFKDSKGYYRCLNYKTKNGFSKNYFIDNYNDFKKWVEKYKDYDCYMNYQPLKEPINRKTENIAQIEFVALDIEMKDKQTPESLNNMLWMYKVLKTFIKYRRIAEYMLINSGNGYHFYIRFDKPLQIRDLQKVKEVYRNVVKRIAHEMRTEISMLRKSYKDDRDMSFDDRKDIAGILRIPTTINTKIDKEVTIMSTSDNGFLRRLWKSESMRKTLKEKKFDSKDLPQANYKGLPKTIEELVKSPLIRIRMDESLPPPKNHGDWHKCIVFAIQAVVYHSGLYKHPEIKEVTRQYNLKCNTHVNLDVCSYTQDLDYPIALALRFCKDNGYDKYYKEIKEMYVENDTNSIKKVAE